METPAAQAPASPKTHVLFPAVVREYQFGDGPLNRELYDRIKRFQVDPTAVNACHVRHIATTGGYQPDVVLHQALAGEPLWQRFMQTVVHPAIQGYLAEHCRVAGWPGPGTAYTITASWRFSIRPAPTRPRTTTATSSASWPTTRASRSGRSRKGRWCWSIRTPSLPTRPPSTGPTTTSSTRETAPRWCFPAGCSTTPMPIY